MSTMLVRVTSGALLLTIVFFVLGCAGGGGGPSVYAGTVGYGPSWGWNYDHGIAVDRPMHMGDPDWGQDVDADWGDDPAWEAAPYD